MSDLTVGRRFRAALEQAAAEWSAADPAACAARAGCAAGPSGVEVPLFGRPHLVAHPRATVTAAGEPAHAAVAILLLHYLLHADGTPPAGDWTAFRDLPDGLFYAASFAQRAEQPLALTFGAGERPEAALEAFRRAAAASGGRSLPLADAAFEFAALPRVALAALLWEGDEEFPAQVRVLFDASAPHYLAAEDLAGVGGVLATRLIGGGR